MKKVSIWYGFLEAGKKSSPVALDRRIETGNPDTVYLFHMMRQEFAEYQWSILEPKLRDLSAEEQAQLPEIKKAFNKARKQFKPKTARIIQLQEHKVAMAAKSDNTDPEEVGALLGAASNMEDDLDMEDFG